MGSVAALLASSELPDQAAVGRMLAAAPHRGNRATVLVHGRCALGVGDREDWSDASLAHEDGLAAALTGTIDNARELASQLGLRNGLPDPARLLIKAFRAFGEGTPARLRGIFAAVLTDGSRAWCFRDHLGQAGLFYRQDGGAFVAASEAKQVVAGAGISAEPDPDVVERIFYGRYDDDTPCALRGVQRLPKATLLRVEDGQLNAAPYWDPEALLETARLSADDARCRFEELMTRAVARSLTGEDVVSLSGGVDSPAVAAFAAPEHLSRTGRPIAAYSTVYPDYPAVDESKYIAIVAEHLGISVHTYVQTAKPLDRVLDWVRIADGPTPVLSLPDVEEHYRVARDCGYRTILTGELAEFVFDMDGHLVAHLLLHGRVGAVRRLVREWRSTGMSPSRIARRLASPLVPRRLMRTLKRGEHPHVPHWIERRKVDTFDYLSLPARRRWRREQLKAFAAPGLTLEADEIVQQVCGVRVRRPFGDVDLWEFFLSLPAEVKFPSAMRKSLVRTMLRGKLPDAILDRRDKTSFEDFVMGGVDYPVLRHWLIEPGHRLDGVRYDLLAEQLQREDLDLFDFMWAKDLAAAHAFLSLW